MIVDPDFADHWKTRMLVGLLGGDEVAPVYILRIWGHCQQRRKWVFQGITQDALKAVCRYSGCAQLLDQSLQTAGFVQRNGDEITVVGWNEYNASLVASWSNGNKGGRPKKKPTGFQKQRFEKPTGSREEKRREDIHPQDKNPSDVATAAASRFVPPTVNEVRDYCTERRNQVDPQAFVDFYTSKGWVVGKSKMRDWRAAVRTWERTDGGRGGGTGGSAGGNSGPMGGPRVRSEGPTGLLAQLADELRRGAGDAERP